MRFDRKMNDKFIHFSWPIEIANTESNTIRSKSTKDRMIRIFQGNNFFMLHTWITLMESYLIEGI